MSKTLLKIDGMNAYYGAARVLWDVSLELRKGEIIALIGANGAGKTTLLRTISGLILKWDGKIFLRGQEILSLNSASMLEQGVAQVPEGRRLFPGMSVQDNLLMGAYLRRDKQEIQKDLRKVYQYLPKLEERKKQLAGKLSGGEQQMCAIARALMSGPEILLIDELSLGLAPVIVDELLKIISQLKEDGMSIILVEQDVQAGLEAADRAYVLEHGRIVMSGASKALMENPKIKESYLGI